MLFSFCALVRVTCREYLKFYSIVLCLSADYETFCQILLQRPFVWGSAGMLFATRVTEDDLSLMTKLAKAHFDSVIVILKQLPRSMLLVFRYNQPKITIHKLLRSVTYSYSRQKLSFSHVSFASFLRPREREREREYPGNEAGLLCAWCTGLHYFPQSS